MRQWFQPVSPLLIGDRYGHGFPKHKSVSDPVPGSVSGPLDAAPILDRWKLHPEIEGQKPDNCRSSFRNRITVEPADLKKFPFDVIKIDKSFIENIERDVTDKEIVTSIIHVAKKLQLAVTVEGIETVQQENFIIDQGCEIGQGFLYGKPMSLEEFESKLLSRKKISAQ